MPVCEDRHPGVDDWFRQHSQVIHCFNRSFLIHIRCETCVPDMGGWFCLCSLLVMYYFSLYVVKHYCIIFVFYFLGRPGLSSLSLTTFVPFI